MGNGLRICVKESDHDECDAKLLSDAFNPLTNDNKFFENTKVPVWVRPDCANVPIETVYSWWCDFSRTLKSHREIKLLGGASGRRTT